MKKIVKLWPVFLLLSAVAACRSASEADVKRVLKEMQSPDPAVRNQAALECANFGSLSPKVVPALIKLLSDENVGVSSGAAYSLRKIASPEAEKALEQATRRRKNPD